MRWYLDVDGVINIVNHPTAPEWEHLTWPAGELRSWLGVRWHPAVVGTVNRFAADPRHEVVWLTTWTHEANGELSERLGIDGFFRVLVRPPGRERVWWKARALALDVADDPTPYIWTDDDLSHSRREEPFVRKVVNAAPVGSLLISPDSKQGLTAVHLTRIREVAGLK